MADTKPPPPPTFTFTADDSVSAFQVPYREYIAAQPVESVRYGFVACAALVFFDPRAPNTPSTMNTTATTGTTPGMTPDRERRILLVQRAAHDSMPLRWEVPGGACDVEDASILHATARELWEEAGLVAAKIGPRVGEGQVWVTRSGKTACKFTFMVDVMDTADASQAGDGQWQGKNGVGAPPPPRVRLDPAEHQRHLWATEEEVASGHVVIVGGDDEVDVKDEVEVVLDFTSTFQRAIILEGFRMKRETH